MKQLQVDRNYTNFLIRLVVERMQSNDFKTTNDLLKYIADIQRNLRSNEVITYINNNNLIFNYQDFSVQLNKLVDDFEKKLSPVKPQPLTNITTENKEQYNFIPITRIDANTTPPGVITEVNSIISNKNYNPHEFQVDTDKGVFFNTKEQKIYPQNFTTNNPNVPTKTKENINTVSSIIKDAVKNEDNNKEFPSTTKEVSKPKTKTRTKKPKLGSSAYISTILVTAGSSIFGIIIATLIFVNR